MHDLMEEKLQEIEAEFDRPLWERLGKVIVVGLATLAVGWIAENQYDRSLGRWKERKAKC